MEEHDPLQVLYHVTKVMESRGKKLDQIQEDLGEIKIDIAVMKQTGLVPQQPEEVKKERMKATAAGGGVGGIIVVVILGLWEVIARKIGL